MILRFNNKLPGNMIIRKIISIFIGVIAVMNTEHIYQLNPGHEEGNTAKGIRDQ